VLEVLGFAGISISALAYAPQVIHLARERCSAGVSGRAWTMWLASSLLVGAVALQRGDPVFIALQLSTLISAAIIVYLTHRYRGMVCATHVHVRSRSGVDWSQP
jgi:lipid-A-disaccharide synthase-like uncharacterized protein